MRVLAGDFVQAGSFETSRNKRRPLQRSRETTAGAVTLQRHEAEEYERSSGEAASTGEGSEE